MNSHAAGEFFGRWAMGILGTMLVIGLVWGANSVIELKEAAMHAKQLEKRMAGCEQRCRVNDARIQAAIEEYRNLRQEDRRLQVQIDRLEGHNPKSYVEDY